MAPKLSSASKSTTKTPKSTGSPSLPSSRPKRTKNLPSKIKEGIDYVHIERRMQQEKALQEKDHSSSSESVSVSLSASKDSSTQSKSPEASKSPIATPSSKRKEPMPEAPTGKRVKMTARRGPSKTHQAESSAPKIVSIEEINKHSTCPEGYNKDDIELNDEDSERFHNEFDSRQFCPVVAVDFKKLREEHDLDLFPEFIQFEKLLTIKAPYSPNLVKLFYLNLETDSLVDKKKRIIEDRLKTNVRGKEIVISATYLNNLLCIENPPPVPNLNYSNEEIFKLLRPGVPVPNNLEHFDFTPAAMPRKNRALWYIYTRNLLQKGGAYTQFASKDFPLFASILDCKPHNIGHWLFNEISRFRFQSRKISKIPFPTLISLILFDHKVWYLTNEETITPPVFGSKQLNQMRLYIEGTDQTQDPSVSKAPSTSKIPQKSKGKAKIFEEVQSKQQPSDLEKAIDKLTDKVETEMSKVLRQVYEKHNALVDDYTELKEKVDKMVQEQTEQRSTLSTLLVTMMSISDKLDLLMKNQGNSDPSAHEVGPSSEVFKEDGFDPKEDADPEDRVSTPPIPSPITSISWEIVPYKPPSQ